MGRIIETNIIYRVTWTRGWADESDGSQTELFDKEDFLIPSAAMACWLDHMSECEFPVLAQIEG